MAARRKPAAKKAPRRGRQTRRRAVEAPRRSPVDRSPFLEALAAVAQFLAATGRPAAIIGGVAVIARGFARSTIDIDATVAAGIEEVEELVKVAAKQGLTPRISNAARFARENLVLLLHHRATGVPVDVSLAQQAFEQQAAAQAEVISFDGVMIPVPSLTALLIYKLVAGRPQDMRDVEALLKTGGRFDSDAVEKTLWEFDEILETSRRAEFRALVKTSLSK